MSVTVLSSVVAVAFCKACKYGAGVAAVLCKDVKDFKNSPWS